MYIFVTPRTLLTDLSWVLVFTVAALLMHGHGCTRDVPATQTHDTGANTRAITHGATHAAPPRADLRGAPSLSDALPVHSAVE